MIDHTQKLIHIHIPKTGGTSIGTALFAGYDKTLHHLARQYEKQHWEAYFSFAIVRNPFDRTLSHYAYHVKSRYNGALYKAHPHLKAMTFEEYVEAFVAEPKLVQFMSQVTYVTHPESDKPIDFIGRFERMQDDFDALCKKLDVAVKLPHMLRSTHAHYARHYTQRAREMVARAYADDLERFGYAFEPDPAAHGRSQPDGGAQAERESLEGSGTGLGQRAPELLCIGSGSFSRLGWKNLDNPSAEYEKRQGAGVDYVHDLMSEAPLPLESGRLDAAYCSHVVEHLSDSAVEHLFRQTHRCLRPGGVFRVSCPDMEHIYRAFVRGDRFFFSRFAFAALLPDLTLPQAFLHCFAYLRTTHAKRRLCEPLSDEAVYTLFREHDLETALQKVVEPIPVGEANRLFPQAHHNFWTMGKLERVLRDAGFETIIAQRFNCTASPHMTDRKAFDATRPFMSLYIEGVR